MSTTFGVELYKAIKKGSIKVNFQGVALGDSWISPMDFVATWADYLLTTSEIDSNGRLQINQSASQVQQAISSGDWNSATDLWGMTEQVIEGVSGGVNFYNILDRSNNEFSRKFATEENLAKRHLAIYHQDPLDDLMNGPIRQKLKIIPANVTWGGQSYLVFTSLSTAFMQPVIDGVDFLLSQGVTVAVYSGNLDLICCTPGTNMWMDKLKWSEYSNFKASDRILIYFNGIVSSFLKEYENLQLWNILSAGHMVPADQPGPALYMLSQIISQSK